jgi:hypothetical protein
MRRDIPGAWYCDATPAGAFVALIPNLRLQTAHGPVALPNGQNLLYVRIAPDGVRFAGQGHADDHVWEWTGSQWQDHGPVLSVSPCIYDHTGRLLLNDGWGSQGARYVDDFNRVVTGDATYFSPQMELSEFSRLSPVIYVGQSHPDGTNDAAWVWDAGTLRLLEPGPCRFIRATFDGHRAAIAIWKPAEGAVIHWLTLAELRALPVVNLPKPGTPAPNPGTPPAPTPEPKMEGITDAQFETLKRVRAKFPTDRKLTPHEIGAVLNEFAWRHRDEIGLQRKDGGTRAYQPRTDIGIWNGVWIKRHGDWGQDVLRAAAEGIAEPARGQIYVGQPDKFEFVPPVQPLDAEPEPEPPPPPPTGPVAHWTELARAEIVAMQTEIALLRIDVDRLQLGRN